MVVGLLFVVLASGELVGAIVGGGDATEAVLIGLIHLLMPLRVSDHLLLLGKHFGFAHGHGAMEMLAVVHVFAIIRTTFQAGAEPTKVSGVIRRRLGTARQNTGSLSRQDVRRDLRGWAGRPRACRRRRW